MKVAIFAVTKVSGVSAAQIGLILTYTSMYSRQLKKDLY